MLLFSLIHSTAFIAMMYNVIKISTLKLKSFIVSSHVTLFIELDNNKTNINSK